LLAGNISGRICPLPSSLVVMQGIITQFISRSCDHIHDFSIII
jgi:hypothetical protein